jgi:hypothetical protein
MFKRRGADALLLLVPGGLIGVRGEGPTSLPASGIAHVRFATSLHRRSEAADVLKSPNREVGVLSDPAYKGDAVSFIRIAKRS